jgi:hypothetical protein
MRRQFALLAVAVLGAATLAISVEARPPFTETFAESASEAVPCDGFEAILVRSFSGRVAVHFDNTGDPARAQVHATMTGSVTNSATGKWVALRGHIHVVDDFRSGVVTWTGSASSKARSCSKQVRIK